MPRHFFALKLVPPRPSFANDMNEEEKGIMQSHINYWVPFVQQDKMIVFGPVLDPAGPYGLGVLAVESEEEMLQLTSNDPAVQICQYEIHPMSAVTK